VLQPFDAGTTRSPLPPRRNWRAPFEARKVKATDAPPEINQVCDLCGSEHDGDAATWPGARS